MNTVKDVIDKIKIIDEVAEKLSKAYNDINVEVNPPIESTFDLDWEPKYIPSDAADEYRGRRYNLNDAVFETVEILSEYKSMLENIKVQCEE